MDRNTTTALSARNRGWRRFALGMFLYGVIVIAIGLIVDRGSLSSLVGVLLAVLPVAAALWAMTGWLAAVRTFDEFQLRVVSEAGLLALGVTAAVTLTYGFLESFAGLPKLSMFYVVPLISFSYLLALPYVRGRYR